MILKKRLWKLNFQFDSSASSSLGEILGEAARKLLDQSGTPRLDAEVLICEALGISPASLVARSQDTPDQAALERIAGFIGRRLKGEPIAYITGHREFWSMDLKVTPDTLIPRPETELLVELALQRIPVNADWTIADLGTGSGAIALAVARERPGCQLIATDQSASALSVAEENADTLGVNNIRFIQADWLDFDYRKKFDMVVSNPPYIEENDPHLFQGDVRFEPTTALASGADGLSDIRRIAGSALDHLDDGGYLLVESGYQQGAAATALLNSLGYADVAVIKDLAGMDRVILARRPVVNGR